MELSSAPRRGPDSAVGSPADSSPPVSVMIFTLDEERNIDACLDSLEWCDDVHVIDSYSEDGTLAICRRRRIPVMQHRFEGFGTQRSWALSEVPTRYEWVLILDADERVPPELVDELRALIPRSPGDVAAYRMRRRFHMWGRWLKHSSLYPTWVVRLVRKGRVEFVDRGHAETQHVAGRIVKLESDLIDHNLKGIDEWFERQNRYSRAEAELEFAGESSSMRGHSLLARDPLERRAALKRIATRLPGRGLLYFLYSYVLRLGFLDGRDGFTFCLMGAIYQSLIAIKKYDIQRHQSPNRATSGEGASSSSRPR